MTLSIDEVGLTFDPFKLKAINTTRDKEILQV